MNRKLIRQIATEWRTNTWLAIELLIVSVVMWFITDQLYTTISIQHENRGFDISHCYLLHFTQLNDNSPEYRQYKDYREKNDDLLTLAERLRGRPEVECLAFGVNAYYYNGSNSGTYMRVDTFDTGDTYYIRRFITPDFLRVFRVQGASGETPGQLAELLRRNPRGVLMSDNSFEHQGVPHMAPFIGRRIYNGSVDDSCTLVGAFVPTRYNDYYPLEASKSMFFVCPDSLLAGNTEELVVRVCENMDHDFARGIMADASGSLRVGNWYIYAVDSFDDIRDAHQRNWDHNKRNRIVGAVFLALNIFLGILGTFWLRTRQRVPEIAIRMVNGATRGDIFRRILAEGQLILLAITPLAILLDWLLTHFELNSYYHGGYFELSRFVASVAITYALMSLMIMLGALIPARRATRIAPAVALNQE